MTNDDNSLRVRGYQMKTWGTFKDVARLSNDFEGLVLPLYLACAVHKWPPYWDASTKAAADRDGDVIIFRLVERQSTTGKALGNGAGRGAGYGAPAMVTNARKISLWFRYAYDHLPYTPFLAKADLDMYINVPAYLTILQQLPRVSTLFGKSRPFRRLFCHGDDVMLYLLGPLYTHTRDVAKEVFSESHVSRRVSDPYSRCYLNEYKKLSLRNEDTVHSQTLFRRYAGNATERVFPAQELRDAVLGAPRLPAVSGLGKLYMDYITDALTTVPLSGRVDGLEGYKYNYSLPGPLNRTHLIFVVDNCRNGDEFKVAPNHYGVFSHRSSRWDLFEAHHRKHNVEGGTFHMMQHPSDLVVKDRAHFYYRVDLSDIDCRFVVGAKINPTENYPGCAEPSDIAP